MTRIVAFDGDDTLWHNEGLFAATHQQFADLLGRHADLDAESLDRRLLAVERRNLALYGYGIKGFMLSMVETAVEVTEGRLPGSEIHAILELGRAMLRHPLELIEGAQEVLETLRAEDRELWLITKGDLFDQEGKIARSGLSHLFQRIEIVSEKDLPLYRRLLQRHGAAPEEFVMVGNSVRSDVLPVLELGARALHVPYHLTWEHERADLAERPPDRLQVLEAITGVPGALQGFGQPR